MKTNSPLLGYAAKSLPGAVTALSGMEDAVLSIPPVVQPAIELRYPILEQKDASGYPTTVFPDTCKFSWAGWNFGTFATSDTLSLCFFDQGTWEISLYANVNPQGAVNDPTSNWFLSFGRVTSAIPLFRFVNTALIPQEYEKTFRFTVHKDYPLQLIQGRNAGLGTGTNLFNWSALVQRLL